eukprot:Gb_34916 [translate_table: standard]
MISITLVACIIYVTATHVIEGGYLDLPLIAPVDITIQMGSPDSIEVPLLEDEFTENTKKVRGSWKACTFILGAKCCERMAFYGVDTNLVTYLTTVLHKGNAAAANISTTWSGTCNVTPLIGAMVADAYLGRYWTLAISSTAYFTGLTALTLFSFLKSPSILLYVGLYVMSLGIGSFTACFVAFGADQFEKSNPRERKMKCSFFNWFFFSVNFGTLVSSSGVVWVEDDVSWVLGFGISTVMIGFAMGIFFIGTPLYRHQKPGGSPLTRICQVLVASLRKLRVQPPLDERLLYEKQDKLSAVPGSQKLGYTNNFKFLDKAATITDDDIKSGGYSNPWRICTVTQVEEVKILIRMLPIWATTGMVFATAYAQSHTMFLEQGRTMDASIGPHFKIPAGSMYIFSSLTCLIWLPVYDKFVVPVMHKYTGNEKGLSELQRMGIGLVISITSMMVAALLEYKRLAIAKGHDLVHNTETTVPLSIFWQLPQYVLLGAAETFVLVGQLEFFYDEAPDAMRSICGAVYHLSMALGNYLNTFLVTAITVMTTKGGRAGWIPDNLNEGHLDYYFLVLALLGLLNLIVYVVCALTYKYKHVK